MSIKAHLKLEESLLHSIGSKHMTEIKESITAIVRQHNLDVTPEVLWDVFRYIHESIAISNAWEKVARTLYRKGNSRRA